MTTVPFKRVLHQGMRGRDVKAVKIGLRRIGYGGGLTQSRVFGPRMGVQLKAFQQHMGLHPDGIYGPATHAKLAPHFSAWARQLYSSQHVPPAPPMSAAAAAKRLLVLAEEGKFRDDRGSVLPQIQATAKGQTVTNIIGEPVHIDPKVLECLVWLIDVKGFTLGCYALCSDHGNDGERGHMGGHAVDISSINGVTVNTASVYTSLLNLLRALQSGEHKPWQLISGGYAYHEDKACQSLCIPYAAYYGEPTLSEHCNHVHVGY
jgi:peptidoglycan hydrolase-like protein with peptidoglycan-binding domain